MALDGRQQDAVSQRRGDTVTGVMVPGRRVAFASARGFTLIELVMTITVMTILTLGVIPLMQMSVKRQKEQQLREALRQMRIAIDEFHRDTVGMPTTGLEGAVRPPSPQPRKRLLILEAVFISDARYSALIIRIDIRPTGNPGERRECDSAGRQSRRPGCSGRKCHRSRQRRTLNQEKSLPARDSDRPDDRQSGVGSALLLRRRRCRLVGRQKRFLMCAQSRKKRHSTWGEVQRLVMAIAGKGRRGEGDGID